MNFMRKWDWNIRFRELGVGSWELGVGSEELGGFFFNLQFTIYSLHSRRNL